MPWDRGAWEKTTSGVGNNDPTYSPPVNIIKNPKKVSNKKNDYLKKILGKFLSQGWKISKKKTNLYLDNNYYNAPYRLSSNSMISQKISKLISNKSNKNKILVVSNNDLILDEVHLEFAIKNNYKIFKSSKSADKLENLVGNIVEFEKINNVLFNDYAIKIFSDTESIGQIQDLKILSENLYYIDNHTSKLLNEFLKSYWQYYELSNFSNIDLNLAEVDVKSEINKLSNELISIKNYIKRMGKILDLLDFKIDNLDEYDLEILNNNPCLIDRDEANDFLNVLNKYRELNSYGHTVSAYLKEFPSNNFILGIITNLKRYVNSQKDYDEINQSIIGLKNQFESRGVHIKDLNDYYEIKEKLPNYGDVLLINGDNDYFILNDKIKEFLMINSSFKDYFERCRENLNFKLGSTHIYLNANNSIENIMDVCEELGVKINSLKDFDNHANDFKTVIDYINFNKMNTVANETTIREYAKNLFDELKEICTTLIESSNEVDENELDYIIYNISILKRQINKMGLNISSLNEINDSFSIIANLENDISGDIFTNQTRSYVQTDTFEIHNDLDILKDALNYLMGKLSDHPNLRDYSLDNLTQSFKNQFKLGFLKSNLESLIESTDSFEDILENYEMIIQNTNNLMDLNDSYDFKTKLDKILKQFNSISQMHENQNYSSNQLMIDNISSHKRSINNEFNKLIGKGLFSKDKLAECNVEEEIRKLNENTDAVRDYITANGFYDMKFSDIIKRNTEIIQRNSELKKKIDESTIYNFYELSNEFDAENNDFKLIHDILDLSSRLNLKQYPEFKNFELEDIADLSKNLEDSFEFEEYRKKGILSSDFNYSSSQFNEIDSNIESIRNKLNSLKLDNSILDGLSQINIYEIDEIKDSLTQIEKYLKCDATNVDESIQNYKISLDMLLNLCNDHYIEFEMNNHKFNTSDFKFNLEEIQEDFEYHLNLYETEKEILSYSDIIENNLSDIWDSPLTDINLIKDKLEIDEEFTKKYNREIYTKKLLENLSEVSQSDLLFLDELKNMDDIDLKSKYILSYKHHEILIPEINKLNRLKKDDLNSVLSVLININKIYKSNEISDCINLLEYNIKHNDSIKLLNEYENELKSHSIVYYKYFNRRQFDMPIENVLSVLENHFKFTQLIDNGIINERYLESIKSNFDDFLKNVEILVKLKDEIIKDCSHYYGATNVAFEEIKESWNDIDDSNLILMNFNTLRNSFNKNYVNYFDYVYFVDDNDLNGEDKLHLFLISKNKLSYLKLMDG